MAVIAYNSVHFDPASSHATVAIEYVRDEANRTVVYQRYTITVRAILQDDDNLDGTLPYMRQLLEQQGRELIFTGMGLGDDLVVNTPSGQGGFRDVKWGPIPEVLEWTPLGANLSAEVVWKVTTCIKQCKYGRRAEPILAINYDIGYAINVSGGTTRTITGYLEIAQTRFLDSRLIPESADTYRYKITPGVPSGFARESQNYQVSQDKSRLDFSIVDRSIPSPNPYPPGVVAIASTRNRITATITLAPKIPQVRAYNTFVAIVKQRIKWALQNSQEGVLLDTIEVEENMYGRQVAFSVGYRVLSPLSELLSATGLWTPVGDEWTWKYWHDSMSIAHSQRGYANQRHFPANDAIVDLCGGDIPWMGEVAEEGDPKERETKALSNTQPPEEKSWVEYDSAVVSTRERPAVRQRVQQAVEYESEEVGPHDTRGPTYTPPGGTSDIIQQSGRGSYNVQLIGSAKRAGYPIPKPVLQSVGGQTAVEVAGDFIQHVIGNFLGVPVYSAAWAIHYALPNSPGTVTAPQNYKDYPV